jgi:hypothetical protein
MNLKDFFIRTSMPPVGLEPARIIDATFLYHGGERAG